MTTTQLRKDAARNWDRIVAIARVLVDQGVTLQLNDVARRAGLGVGTVYRHFATPEALLETVATPAWKPWPPTANRHWPIRIPGAHSKAS